MVDLRKNRLATLMEQRGVSRRDLAVALDVTEYTVARLEKPERLIPSKYIPTLAEVLKVSPEYLMGWDHEPTEEAA